MKLSEANSTWLNYAPRPGPVPGLLRDDFSRGDRFAYDLKLQTSDDQGNITSSIRTFSDITMIRISKTGSDGWCLRGLWLEVNGVQIFELYNIPPNPPNPSATGDARFCRWLDNTGGLQPTMEIRTLRGTRLWEDYTQPALPLRITREEMQSRIEAYTGDWMHGYSIDLPVWGHSTLDWRHGVICGKSRNAGARALLDCHFGLVAKIPRLKNPGIDVDIDVEFCCSNMRLSVRPLHQPKTDTRFPFPEVIPNLNSGQV